MDNKIYIASNITGYPDYQIKFMKAMEQFANQGAMLELAYCNYTGKDSYLRRSAPDHRYAPARSEAEDHCEGKCVMRKAAM